MSRMPGCRAVVSTWASDRPRSALSANGSARAGQTPPAAGPKSSAAWPAPCDRLLLISASDVETALAAEARAPATAGHIRNRTELSIVGTRPASRLSRDTIRGPGQPARVVRRDIGGAPHTMEKRGSHGRHHDRSHSTWRFSRYRGRTYRTGRARRTRLHRDHGRAVRAAHDAAGRSHRPGGARR